MRSIQQLLTITHPDADTRRRGHLLVIILIGMIIASALPLPFVLIAVKSTLLSGILSVCIVMYTGALWLVRRVHVNLVGWLVSIVTIIANGSIVFVGRTFVALFFLALSIIIAGLVLPPRHSWGVLLLAEAGMAIVVLLRQSWLADPFNAEVTICVALFLVLVTIFSYFGADAIQKAIRESEANAERATHAQMLAEAQARELATQTTALRNAEGQMYDLVATLETSTVALVDGVLLAPLIGVLDTRRAGALMQRLLHDVSAQRVRLLLLDVAGVPVIDRDVAGLLTSIAQAVRLLGCQVVITGITPGVALALIHLGINFSEFQTARSPQDVLVALANGRSFADNQFLWSGYQAN